MASPYQGILDGLTAERDRLASIIGHLDDAIVALESLVSADDEGYGLPTQVRRDEPVRRDPAEIVQRDDRTPAQCERCGGWFFEGQSIMSHRRYCGAEKFPCPDCPISKRRFTQTGLTLHHRLKHRSLNASLTSEQIEENRRVRAASEAEIAEAEPEPSTLLCDKPGCDFTTGKRFDARAAKISLMTHNRHKHSAVVVRELTPGEEVPIEQYHGNGLVLVDPHEEAEEQSSSIHTSKLHIHHWKIGTPRGGKSIGKCKGCDAEKDFPEFAYTPLSKSRKK